MRNCIGEPANIYASTGAADTRLPSGVNQVSNYSSGSYIHYDILTAKDATGTTPSRPFNFRIQLAAGKSFSCDVRVSLYEGEYGGPYKPYVDQTLSNRVKSAETSIEQNAEAITLRATKTEVQQVRPAYASSSTAAGTAAKVATIDPAVTGYALYKGATVSVTFSTANTAATPTLNVNSTGAKQIRSYTGAALSEAEYEWAAGATLDLVYDGTYWRMQDGGAVKRVTAAEASISVNAENIESKVSKDGVISSINQSAETVKIQASKVEIDGTAVFTAISSDVDDAITDKGYATTTQAQGYASTAKSEAISAAATDATNKANAAQTAATNAANTATDNKLKSYSTTAQANELYDAKGAAEDVQTNLNSARSWYAECSTAAATVAKVATITPATTDFKLANGVVVNVKFSATNTGAVGSLTLNVNGTGAKSIKTQRSNSLTNLGHAGVLYQNAVIPFVYNGQYWLAIENYNSDTYNRVRWQNVVTILEKPTGTWRILCGTASGYKQIAAGVTFDLAYPILSFSNQPEANATADTGYLSINSQNFVNTAAVQSGAAGKTIFLKGTVSGNTFTIDSTNVFTTVIPTSEDGRFYIPLGIMTTASVGYFESSKDLYAFLDGRFRQVTPTEIVASQRIYYRSKVSGTVPKPTAWITLATNKYNGTVSVGNDGWRTKVTPIAESKAENVTKYLYLYTCEQRKRLDGTVECTDVTLDENTTIIDGGNIITHTVTAEQLNATSINASKTLTVGAMTDDAAGTILNSNVVVGGRNLLQKTEQPSSENVYLVRSVITDGVIRTTPTTSDAYADWKVNYLDYAEYNDGEYTISVDVRLSASSNGYTSINSRIYLGYKLASRWAGTFSSNYDRFTSKSISGITNEWNRVSVTFKVPDDLKSGQASALVAGSFLSVEFYCGKEAAAVDWRRPKLEKGNKATDWTPAPEDVDLAIEQSVAGQGGFTIL